MLATNKRIGFTVVELLIVIVVIAILASISIVAYSGIQARAGNTQTTAVVSSYTKALSLYAVDKGTYPSTALYPCLGSYEGASGCARLVMGTPGCGWAGIAPVDSAFDAELERYLGSKPSGSDQKAFCNGDQYMGAYMNANSGNPKVAVIQYFLKGSANCITPDSSILQSRTQIDDATRCIIRMPSLP